MVQENLRCFSTGPFAILFAGNLPREAALSAILTGFCFLSQKLFSLWVSLIAQLVKNPLAMQETPVWFLGQEDPLEKAIATHSSILAWRIPWTVLMHNPFGIFQIVNICQNCDIFIPAFCLCIYMIFWVGMYIYMFSKPGFSNTWTMNFQMFKLVLEKAEEPEIKFPTSAGSLKSNRVPEKYLFLLYWLCQSLWLCGSQ